MGFLLSSLGLLVLFATIKIFSLVSSSFSCHSDTLGQAGQAVIIREVGF